MDRSLITGEDTNEYDGLIADEETARTVTLRNSMLQGTAKEPDAFAKIRKLSEASGLPTDVVEHDPQRVEQQLRFTPNEYDDLIESAPATAKYFSKPENAAISHDEISLFGEVENWISRSFENADKTMPLNLENAGRGAAVNVMDAMLKQAYESLPMRMMAEPEIGESIKGNINEQIDQIVANKKTIAQLTPKDLDIVQEGLRSGLESLVSNAPGFVAMLLTRSPNWMLAPMTAQTYFGSYAEARSEGREAGAASQYAAVDAAIEFLTEKMPTEALAKLAGGGDLRKNLVKFLIGEMGGEQVATLTQSANAYLHDLDEELAKATTWEDKLEIQGRRQAVTAVATLFAGGAQAGVAGGIGRLAEKMASKPVISDTEQKRIDKIHQLAAETKTIERDREAYRDQLNQIQEHYGKDESVYLPAEDVAELFQEEQLQELAQSSPAMAAIAEQLPAALKMGGDIVIPIADYITDIAAGDLAEQLRPVIRLSPDTLSMKEAEGFDQEQAGFIQRVVETANQNAQTRIEAEDIAAQITEQLTATGRVSPRAAKLNAKVVSAFVATTAARTGKSVQEVYDAMGLQIQGAVEQAPVERAEKTPYKRQQNFANITIPVTGFHKGERVTVNQDAQLMWEHKQQRRERLTKLLDCING